MRRGLVTAMCLAFAGLAATVAAGAPHDAQLSCSVSGARAQFDVERWSRRQIFQLRRFGDDIGGNIIGFSPRTRERVNCEGNSAAVTDLDQILVTQDRPRGQYNASTFTVDMSEGEF